MHHQSLVGAGSNATRALQKEPVRVILDASILLLWDAFQSNKSLLPLSPFSVTGTVGVDNWFFPLHFIDPELDVGKEDILLSH